MIKAHPLHGPNKLKLDPTSTSKALPPCKLTCELKRYAQAARN